MTAPESLPCDCGAVVPVDRWGEHRQTCPAAWWREPAQRFADDIDQTVGRWIVGDFTPRPGTRYA